MPNPIPLFQERHLDVDGVERDYLIHEPFPLIAGRAYPLILAFHGGTPVTTDPKGTKDARHSMATHWEAIAAALPADVRIVCPLADWVPQDDDTARGRYKWRHVLPGSTEVPREDPNFVTALLDKYGKDPDRTYAVGFSSGGGMTGQLTLLDDFVDRIRGYAVISYPFYFAQKIALGDARAQVTPKPLLYMHGTADDNWVRYHDDGSGNLEIQALPPEIMRDWKNRNHTEDEPEYTTILTVDRDMAMIEQLFLPRSTAPLIQPIASRSRREVNRSLPSFRRRETTAGEPLSFITNLNAGHNWPRKPGQGAKLITTISTTYLIWNFWTYHAGLVVGPSPGLRSVIFDPEQ